LCVCVKNPRGSVCVYEGGYIDTHTHVPPILLPPGSFLLSFFGRTILHITLFYNSSFI
jgi:hypothetical protein